MNSPLDRNTFSIWFILSNSMFFLSNRSFVSLFTLSSCSRFEPGLVARCGSDTIAQKYFPADSANLSINLACITEESCDMMDGTSTESVSAGLEEKPGAAVLLPLSWEGMNVSGTVDEHKDITSPAVGSSCKEAENVKKSSKSMRSLSSVGQPGYLASEVSWLQKLIKSLSDSSSISLSYESHRGETSTGDLR